MTRATFGLVMAILGAGPLGSQAPRYEVGLGYAGGGPTRLGADFATVSGAVRVASVRGLTLSAELGAMFRTSPVNIELLDCAFCKEDSMEVRNVARLALTARVGGRDGMGSYLLASVGGWASTWNTPTWRDRSGVAGGPFAAPVGGTAQAGVGTSLPFGDRRTVVEGRVGLFGGLRRTMPGGRSPAGPLGLQLSIARRW